MKEFSWLINYKKHDAINISKKQSQNLFKVREEVTMKCYFIDGSCQNFMSFANGGISIWSRSKAWKVIMIKLCKEISLAGYDFTTCLSVATRRVISVWGETRLHYEAFIRRTSRLLLKCHGLNRRYSIWIDVLLNWTLENF